MARVEIGKSIVVFSAKGGVGKTQTVLNLAGIYSKKKKRVLIMDFDLFNGGIALSLNIEPNKTLFNLVDDLNNNNFKDFNNYVTKYNEYISFLACPKDPRQGSKIDSKYIELVMEKAELLFDVILIDTTHSLNEINLTLLDRVQRILFVVTNDPMDIKNMKSIISIFRDLDITKYKMLLNNSRDPNKDYYSLFDLKNILKCNIDYIISSLFYLRSIDKYVIDGKILTLESKMPNYYPKDYKTYVLIANDLIEDGVEI